MQPGRHFWFGQRPGRGQLSFPGGCLQESPDRSAPPSPVQVKGRGAPSPLRSVLRPRPQMSRAPTVTSGRGNGRSSVRESQADLLIPGLAPETPWKGRLDLQA